MISWVPALRFAAAGMTAKGNYGAEFHVYILASQRNGTLYVGVTSNLSRRVYEHREGIIRGFTHRYGVKSLVWYEDFPTALEAIAAEKRIKRWRRAWKLELIEKINPQWIDLYLSLNG